MTSRLISLLRCPTCRTGTLERGDAGPPALVCAACGNVVVISKGVPRFVAPQNYSDTFGMQWNIHSRTQLDSYSGLPVSRDRLFRTTRWPENLAGQTILEAGSGAGRFTEILATTGAQIISCDLSTAVDANFANNGHNSNLLIMQADLRDLPIPPKTMDKVLCLGVVQHTPNPQVTFSTLAQYVKPGGQLVIDIYALRITALLSWKYLLRPITKRVEKKALYKLIANATPPLVPLAAWLYRWFGRPGARVLPIAQYEHLGLPPHLSKEWAVLDTFDMYSPAHDHPQSVATVKRWFSEIGFVDVHVGIGDNGIVGRGRRPDASRH